MPAARWYIQITLTLCYFSTSPAETDFFTFCIHFHDFVVKKNAFHKRFCCQYTPKISASAGKSGTFTSCSRGKSYTISVDCIVSIHSNRYHRNRCFLEFLALWKHFLDVFQQEKHKKKKKRVGHPISGGVTICSQIARRQEGSWCRTPNFVGPPLPLVHSAADEIFWTSGPPFLWPKSFPQLKLSSYIKCFLQGFLYLITVVRT